MTAKMCSVGTQQMSSRRGHLNVEAVNISSFECSCNSGEYLGRKSIEIYILIVYLSKTVLYNKFCTVLSS